MAVGQERRPTRPETARWDLLAALALLAIGLGVRWLYVRAVAFPPLDDPAFYLTSAKNLVAGRGLVIDALWSYQLLPATVTHPSHEHWMPLTTGVIASAFTLMGSSLRAGQLPGMILGALLAPFTYLAGRRALPCATSNRRSGGSRNRWTALGAALLIAVNATLGYQSASADSSAPYALLAAGALLAASAARATRFGAIVTGMLAALAYLTRSDGLLLLAAIPLAWWLLPASPGRHRQEKEPEEGQPHAETAAPTARRRPGLAAAAVMVLAFALAIAPWLARNQYAFGTPLPASVLSQARLYDYVDTFNLALPTWDSLFARGRQALCLQRAEALLHNGGVFLLSTFPWGLLALPGVWLLRRERAFSLPFVYGLLLFLATAIVFPVSTVSGTFYHSLGAVAPFLALAALYAVQWASEHLGRAHNLARPLLAGILAGLVVLAGAQTALTLPTIAKRHQAEGEQFGAVAAWLDQNAAPGSVIMTTQPYSLNYASGYPAIVLPGNEPPDAAWQAAQRYGARWLVITQTFGRYPDILHQDPDPRFRLVDSISGAEIYAIEGGQP